MLTFILIFTIYSQYRYENATSVCEKIGNRESFLIKLKEGENNKTMARLLFVYYAHKCINLSENEKKKIRNLRR